MSDVDVLAYWKQRHRIHAQTWRASGAGSQGRLAVRKAHLVNTLVADVHAESLLDLGCGDGRVARLIDVPHYIGLDPAPAAIELCREQLTGAGEAHIYDPYDELAETADIAVSLDVIFHLDDDLYERHLHHLFQNAQRAVGIYSTDGLAPSEAAHVQHHAVSADVTSRFPEWLLTERIPPAWPVEHHGRRGSDSWWLTWRRK